jgi:hypothetical protein
MVRRPSPVCFRYLLAPLFAVLFVPATAAQAQPILARARSWAARLENRFKASLSEPGGNAIRFGRDLVVDNGESLDYVACFLCSARIDGAAQGDLLVFAGNTYLNGPVQGDVVDLGGRVTLTSNARIGGNLILFGGRLEQDPRSTVGHKGLIVGPIVFLPMVLILGVLIAGLIVLLRILSGRFQTRY